MRLSSPREGVRPRSLAARRIAAMMSFFCMKANNKRKCGFWQARNLKPQRTLRNTKLGRVVSRTHDLKGHGFSRADVLLSKICHSEPWACEGEESALLESHQAAGQQHIPHPL